MFTNLSVSRALAQGKLVVSVDASRPSDHAFKLPSPLLTLLKADIAGLETEDSKTHGAEGARAEASGTSRAAFDKLETVLRMGYNGIGAIIGDDILPNGISNADRLGLFTTYGWEKGQLGRFTDDRTLILGELALQGSTTIENPAWQYTSTLLSIIRAQLDIIETEDSESTGGARQVSVADRSDKCDLLETHLSRARYFYCSASDDLDGTKELAKIAFQPRRARVTAAEVAPVPAVA